MKKCPACGQTSTDDQVYCMHCGTLLGESGENVRKDTGEGEDFSQLREQIERQESIIRDLRRYLEKERGKSAILALQLNFINRKYHWAILMIAMFVCAGFMFYFLLMFA